MHWKYKQENKTRKREPNSKQMASPFLWLCALLMFQRNHTTLMLSIIFPGQTPNVLFLFVTDYSSIPIHEPELKIHLSEREGNHHGFLTWHPKKYLTGLKSLFG